MSEPNVRVLLVEDHAMVARGIEAALAEEDGLEIVGIAGTVDEGVMRFKQLGPDVVVMDYRLPDGEGTEATRRIRVIDGEAVVLLLTGADDPSIVSDALDSGCSGFVSKDRDVDDLVSAIRAVARGAAVFPADLLSRALSPSTDKQGVGADLTAREARGAGDARRRLLDRGDRERPVPEPPHRPQPRAQHPHEAARPDEAGGRRHRGTRGIGRSAPRHVRSLRARVALIVVLAFVPAFVVVYLISRNDRTDARNDSADETRALAANVAEQYDHLIGDTQTLLRAIGSIPPNDVVLAQCDPALAAITRQSPTYSNLFIVEADGTVVCSAKPVAPTVDPDSEWLTQAMSEGWLRRPRRRHRLQQDVHGRDRHGRHQRSVRRCRADRARRPRVGRRFDGVVHHGIGHGRRRGERHPVPTARRRHRRPRRDELRLVRGAAPFREPRRRRHQGPGRRPAHLHR